MLPNLYDILDPIRSYDFSLSIIIIWLLPSRGADGNIKNGNISYNVV